MILLGLTWANMGLFGPLTDLAGISWALNGPHEPYPGLGWNWRGPTMGPYKVLYKLA